jgi:hypothetical protein
MQTPGDRKSALHGVLTWAEANGAQVEETETTVVVHLEDMIFTFSVVTSSGAPELVGAVRLPSGVPESRTPDRIEQTSGEPSTLELVAAINAGVLTREIDAAVAWDPELAV